MKVKKILGRVLLVLLAFLVLFLSVNLRWVVYGVTQAYGQFKIINEAENVQELLNDPLQPDTLKQRLHFIDSVKRFAWESLGLANSTIYSSVYDQKGEPVMYVVMAAQPFRLEDYQWEVPLLGKFPYLGFFSKERAIDERKRLIDQGLDCRIRTVDGWSTLGFIDNPLLSENLAGSKGQLANLVLHEIAHETVYVLEDTEFNENLASFIGDLGADWLLSDFYGPESSELIKYRKEEEDYEKFTKHMLRGTEYLRAFYDTLNHSLPFNLKKELKDTMIGKVMQSLDTISFHDSTRFEPLFREYIPDNSYFMSFVRYRSNQDHLRNELNTTYNGNLYSYIEYLKKRYGRLFP